MGKFFSGISFKKIISAAAALAMTISCVGTAFAEDSTSKVKVDVSYDTDGKMTYEWNFSTYAAGTALTSADKDTASTFDAGYGLSFTKAAGAAAAISAIDNTSVTIDNAAKILDVYSTASWVGDDSGDAARYATFTAPYNGTFSFTIYSNTTSNKPKYRAYYTSSGTGTPSLPNKGDMTTTGTSQVPNSGDGSNGATLSITMTKGTTYNIAPFAYSNSSVVGISEIKFVTTESVTESTHSEGFSFDIKSSEIGEKSLTVKTGTGSGDTSTVSLSELLKDGTAITGTADLSLAIIFTNIPEGVSITSAVIE